MPFGSDLHYPFRPSQPKSRVLLNSAKLHGSTGLQNLKMDRVPYLTFSAGIYRKCFVQGPQILNKPYKPKFLGPLLGSSSIGQKKKIGTAVTKAASLPKSTKKNVYKEINYSDATAGHFKPGVQN